MLEGKPKMDCITLFLSNEKSNRIWRCLLRDCLGYEIRMHGLEEAPNKDDIHSGLFMIEVWDDRLAAPIGFARAEGLFEEYKTLLIFNRKPDSNFDDEGPCWITYGFFGSLENKINGIISGTGDLQHDFQIQKKEYLKLAEKYSFLKSKKTGTHH